MRKSYICDVICSLSRFRICLASTRMAKLALKRYYRCIDTPSGAEYYFNPKTGEKHFWKILREERGKTLVARICFYLFRTSQLDGGIGGVPADTSPPPPPSPQYTFPARCCFYLGSILKRTYSMFDAITQPNVTPRVAHENPRKIVVDKTSRPGKVRYPHGDRHAGGRRTAISAHVPRVWAGAGHGVSHYNSACHSV